MAKSKPRTNARELLAVFDTNALWTQTPGDLINADMRALREAKQFCHRTEILVS